MPGKVAPTPEAVYKAGQELKKRRLTMWGSLKQAEEKTGINFKTLSSLERGKFTNPSAELLTRLSMGYRIPLQTLIAWYGYEAYYGEHPKDNEN